MCVCPFFLNIISKEQLSSQNEKKPKQTVEKINYQLQKERQGPKKNPTLKVLL